MPINEHTAGLQYERLIMKAFNCRYGENGAKGNNFKNLYLAERGDPSGLVTESYKEQFEDIRNNLFGALKELQNKGLDKDKLNSFAKRIDTCSTANCLAKQVKKIHIFLQEND